MEYPMRLLCAHSLTKNYHELNQIYFFCEFFTFFFDRMKMMIIIYGFDQNRLDWLISTSKFVHLNCSIVMNGKCCALQSGTAKSRLFLCFFFASLVGVYHVIVSSERLAFNVISLFSQPAGIHSKLFHFLAVCVCVCVPRRGPVQWTN